MKTIRRALLACFIASLAPTVVHATTYKIDNELIATGTFNQTVGENVVSVIDVANLVFSTNSRTGATYTTADIVNVGCYVTSSATAIGTHLKILSYASNQLTGNGNFPAVTIGDAFELTIGCNTNTGTSHIQGAGTAGPYMTINRALSVADTPGAVHSISVRKSNRIYDESQTSFRNIGGTATDGPNSVIDDPNISNWLTVTSVNAVVHVVSGTAANTGLYTITAVATDNITVSGDIGNGGAASNLVYSIRKTYLEWNHTGDSYALFGIYCPSGGTCFTATSVATSDLGPASAAENGTALNSVNFPIIRPSNSTNCAVFTAISGTSTATIGVVKLQHDGNAQKLLSSTITTGNQISVDQAEIGDIKVDFSSEQFGFYDGSTTGNGATNKRFTFSKSRFNVSGRCMYVQCCRTLSVDKCDFNHTPKVGSSADPLLSVNCQTNDPNWHVNNIIVTNNDFETFATALTPPITLNTECIKLVGINNAGTGTTGNPYLSGLRYCDHCNISGNRFYNRFTGSCFITGPMPSLRFSDNLCYTDVENAGGPINLAPDNDIFQENGNPKNRRTVYAGTVGSGSTASAAVLTSSGAVVLSGTADAYRYKGIRIASAGFTPSQWSDAAPAQRSYPKVQERRISGWEATEVQTVTFVSASGDVQYTFGGQQTAALSISSSSATIQTAMQGLSSIGSGNMTVTGTGGTNGTYTFTFAGTLVEQNVAQITVTAPTTGGTASIRTNHDGAAALTANVWPNFEYTPLSGDTYEIFEEVLQSCLVENNLVEHLNTTNLAIGRVSNFHGILVGQGWDNVVCAYNTVKGADYGLVIKGEHGVYSGNYTSGGCGIIVKGGQNNIIRNNSCDTYLLAANGNPLACLWLSDKSDEQSGAATGATPNPQVQYVTPAKCSGNVITDNIFSVRLVNAVAVLGEGIGVYDSLNDDTGWATHPSLYPPFQWNRLNRNDYWRDGIHEVQRVIFGVGSAGTVQYTVGGITTAALAINADKATIQAALEALPAIGSGNVAVSGVGGANGSYLFHYKNLLGLTNIADSFMTVTATPSGGGTASISTLTHGTAADNVLDAPIASVNGSNQNQLSDLRTAYSGFVPPAATNWVRLDIYAFPDNDAASLAANPGFTNPNIGDLRIESWSPAWGVGAGGGNIGATSGGSGGSASYRPERVGRNY